MRLLVFRATNELEIETAFASMVEQRLPSAYSCRLVYDSIVHAAKPLRFLADSVGIAQIVLGTDYSFPPADLDPLTSLRAAGFSPADIEKVAEANPRRLFKRLRA